MADGRMDRLAAQPQQLVHVEPQHQGAGNADDGELAQRLAQLHPGCAATACAACPAIGLRREKSGASALPLNDQPPSASGAPTAAINVSTSTGATACSAIGDRSPKARGHRDARRACCSREWSRPPRIISPSWRATRFADDLAARCRREHHGGRGQVARARNPAFAARILQPLLRCVLLYDPGARFSAMALVPTRIRSAAKSRLSRISWMNPDCTAGRPASTISSPPISVTGKPMANRFSDGAARLTTPKARFTMSSAVSPGSATISAPRNSWVPHKRDLPDARRTQPGGADRQGAETVHHGLDDGDMPVQGQEGQRGDQRVELPEHRRAGAPQRIDVEGKRQAHGVGQQLPAHRQRIEDDLQHEADGNADDELLRGDHDARRRRMATPRAVAAAAVQPAA